MLAEQVPHDPIDGASASPSEHTLGEILPRFDEAYCNEPYVDDVLAGRFCFNNETYELGKRFDWLKNPSADVEWHISLHKFYYAPGLARTYALRKQECYRNRFQSLIEDWIAQVPAGYIAADVTARRIQNWIYAWYIFNKNEAGFHFEFEKAFVTSLVTQVNYLIEHLAPARNHRTLELYAVFLAGVAFVDLPDATAWREFAKREMLANIESDLLADGVHCELSTDYHHIVLRSYLMFVLLAQMNDIELPAACMRRIASALDFAMHIHRPDGKIPALSDSDSRDFRDLLVLGDVIFNRADYVYVATSGAAGSAPAHTNRVFESSGYAVLRSPWEGAESYQAARYLVFDAGPIGAGNHGHLDALSIEVAAYGKPLIVDPGRYTYHEGREYNWRAHFRETRAHNTVTVDDEDQAIYRQQGDRRKILRPPPVTKLEEYALAGSLPYVHGSIKSPNYDAIHQREIWFPAHRYWVVLDRLTSDHIHDYALRFQLTPSAESHLTQQTHNDAIEIRVPGLTLVTLADSANVSIEDGLVSTTYGEKRQAPRICIRARARNHCFLTLVYPVNANAPDITALTQPTRQTLFLNDDERCDFWALDQAAAQLVAYTSNDDWDLPSRSTDV